MIYKSHFKDIMMIIMGNVSMAFAYTEWMVPNKIINGGITSLSQILNKYLNLSIPTINSWLLVIILMLSLVFLGREVFLKSVLSSVAYSIMFTIFYQLKWNLNINPILDLLIASLFITFGYYACISANGSTVGVDVIALIIQRKWHQMNLARVIMSLNILILMIGLFTFGVWAAILGIIFSLIYSRELNWMFHNFSKYKVKMVKTWK